MLPHPRRVFEVEDRTQTQVTPSEYIGHAPEVLRPGDRVVLYCRVSGREQNRLGTLGNQVAFLRRAAAALGLEVVGACAVAVPGWDPWRLDEAVGAARAVGACLLAHSTDRFVRCPGYHTLRDRVRPGWCELTGLSVLAGGVPLVTLLHPDAAPAEVRAAQRDRGQAVSGNKGGRPVAKTPGYKKRRREHLLARVLELRGQGRSLREIEDLVGVPRGTVAAWLNRFAVSEG